MEKSLKFCHSIKKILPFFLLCTFAYAQPNCDAFLYLGNDKKFKACKIVTHAQATYYQFDKRFHEKLNEAIEICPSFAYAYREKAYAYIKSGNFLEWSKNIDLAVKYNPKEHLQERASLRYKFFADYQGTIKDIDTLNSILSYDIGYSHDGTYHLNIIKGLCLKAIGETDKAIEIITKQSEIEGDFGVYNYLHLGVLYLGKKDYLQAIKCFDKQSEINNIAENKYYKALCYKELNNIQKAKKYLTNALELYNDGYKMFDGYNKLFDQIYQSDIIRELKLITD